MANSIQSTTNYVTSVVVILLIAVVLANGVYIRDRKKYPSRDYAEESSHTSSLSRHQKTQNISAEVASSRREPFRRILVLCNYDNECDRKSFCHGGEGHKSCLPCRRSRRRCQRNGMCCHGYVCQQGRCVPKERRYADTSFAKASQSYIEEGSISQHTKDNMRKRREDEVCDSADQCGEGLCCAQHFWTHICKPILVEGDVCTKRRDRYSDVFQRCHCGGSLSCKRHPAPDERYHTCQNVKGGKRLEVYEQGYDENVEMEEIHEGLGAVLTLMKDTQESVPKMGAQPQGESSPQAETENAESDKRVEIIEYGSETQSEFKESMESVWKVNVADEDRQIQDQLISDNIVLHLTPTGTSLVNGDGSVRTETESIAVS